MVMVSYCELSCTPQQILQDYGAKWAERQLSSESDALVLARFESFLQESALHPSNNHFTSSALIVHDESKQVLLRYHKKIQAWVQAGGHLNDQESLTEACLREVLEETGLRHPQDIAWHPSLLGPDRIPIPMHLSVFDVPGFGEQLAHRHYDVCYLLKAGKRHAVQEPLRWFALEDQDTLNRQGDAGVRALIEKYKALGL